MDEQILPVFLAEREARRCQIIQRGREPLSAVCLLLSALSSHDALQRLGSPSPTQTREETVTEGELHQLFSRCERSS